MAEGSVSVTEGQQEGQSCGMGVGNLIPAPGPWAVLALSGPQSPCSGLHEQEAGLALL